MRLGPTPIPSPHAYSYNPVRIITTLTPRKTAWHKLCMLLPTLLPPRACGGIDGTPEGSHPSPACRETTQTKIKMK
ncbi:hypothetical protein BGZ61DRAFT_149176 [Ilyonectria robusta]|uniref:uncharacterized protein n=1 Tax=Ilyonectria robusta TaxID=1079257 RepID=UPI001E8D9DC4|nr:uncharacterized protein BGZ61DRAFT_149176 [Ilyonectria robusta]KAH8661267.1 hypothetical protein BGZ61DRAFT_149176 [Ilyonectria robusta]